MFLRRKCLLPFVAVVLSMLSVMSARALDPLAFDLDITPISFAEETLGAVRNTLVLGTETNLPKATLTVRSGTGLESGQPLFLTFTLSHRARFADFDRTGAEVVGAGELGMASLEAGDLEFEEAQAGSALLSMGLHGGAPTSADGSVTWVVHPSPPGVPGQPALEAGDTFTLSLRGVWNLPLLGISHDDISLQVDILPATGEDITLNGSPITYTPSDNPPPPQSLEAELLNVQSRFQLTATAMDDGVRYPFRSAMPSGSTRVNGLLHDGNSLANGAVVTVASLALAETPAVHDRSGELLSLQDGDMLRVRVDGTWTGNQVFVDFNNNNAADTGEIVTPGAHATGSLAVSATAQDTSFTGTPPVVKYAVMNSDSRPFDIGRLPNPPASDFRVRLLLDFASEDLSDESASVVHTILRPELTSLGNPERNPDETPREWRLLGTVNLVRPLCDTSSIADSYDTTYRHNFHAVLNGVHDRDQLGVLSRVVLYDQAGTYLYMSPPSGPRVTDDDGNTLPRIRTSRSLVQELRFAGCPSELSTGLFKVVIYEDLQVGEPEYMPLHTTVRTPAGEVPWVKSVVRDRHKPLAALD